MQAALTEWELVGRADAVALADLGCTTAQGCHLSRPLPGRALDRWSAVRDARTLSGATAPPG